MRLSKALLVMRKEWSELRANRLLLLSMSALPVIFTFIPVVIVGVALRTMTPGNAAQISDELGKMKEFAGLPPEQAVVMMIVRNWIGMFLMLPVFVPIVISAQAIVGEKEKRTIEPLLAAPISTSELLLGKTLASFLPGLVITWGAFVVFAGLIDVLAFPVFGRLVVPDLTWAMAMLLVAPLLALFGNGLSVVVSSRVNDARLAQQLAGTAVLPLVAAFVVQMARGVSFGPAFYGFSALALALVDLVLYLAAVRLFDRERILTSLR
jgi:ABC-2 type transport system permease protein